jgi:hypothetical protein
VNYFIDISVVFVLFLLMSWFYLIFLSFMLIPQSLTFNEIWLLRTALSFVFLVFLHFGNSNVFCSPTNSKYVQLLDFVSIYVLPTLGLKIIINVLKVLIHSSLFSFLTQLEGTHHNNWMQTEPDSSPVFALKCVIHCYCKDAAFWISTCCGTLKDSSTLNDTVSLVCFKLVKYTLWIFILLFDILLIIFIVYVCIIMHLWL